VRLADSLRALVESFVGKRLDYQALYPCTVVNFMPTGVVDVVPDDPKFRGTGFQGIKIRHGLPGFTCEVSHGARGLLGFDAGDPQRPYFSLWDNGTWVDSITFDGGTHDVAREGDQCTGGFLIWDPAILVLYWAPRMFGGIPGPYIPVTLNATTPIPPVPGTPGTDLVGLITAGNARFHA
jgi:hypothetical protein